MVDDPFGLFIQRVQTCIIHLFSIDDLWLYCSDAFLTEMELESHLYRIKQR